MAPPSSANNGRAGPGREEHREERERGQTREAIGPTDRSARTTEGGTGESGPGREEREECVPPVPTDSAEPFSRIPVDGNPWMGEDGMGDGRAERRERQRPKEANENGSAAPQPQIKMLF